MRLRFHYGGVVDACAGKTDFARYGSDWPSGRFGANTYGDCRDPVAGGSSYCSTVAVAGRCGYYYNWQAVMQHPNARAGGFYGTPRFKGSGK